MRANRADETENDGSAPRGGLANGTTRFALFGEVLLVGVIVLVLSLPVVTVVPVLAVGVRHLGRFLVGENDSLRRMLRDLPPAMRDLWTLGLLTPAALVLLAYNVWFARTGLQPGGQAFGVVNAVVAAGVVVVALRVAGAWIPGQHWWRSVRAAARCARLDLGGRVLEITGIPGHHDSSISILDPWTGFLLTGDSVYPGRLYVQDMVAFTDSLDRLLRLAESHGVRHVLGCHIEMSRTPGREYPLGATYQPQEPPLQMTVSQLRAVRDAAVSVADSPGAHVFDDFAIFNGPCRMPIARQRVRRVWTFLCRS